MLAPQQEVESVIRQLAEARIRKGWSKRRLAIAAGVDPKTVGLIERGERSPTLLTLLMLTDALGENLRSFLSNHPPPTVR